MILIRSGLTNTIALGLMRIRGKTPAKSSVHGKVHGSLRIRSATVEDKWNNWVFEIQTQPRFSVEKSVESYSWNNYFSADRITPEWKILFGASQNYSKNIYIREKFDDETSTTYTVKTNAIRESWSVSNTTVNSLGTLVNRLQVGPVIFHIQQPQV